MKERSVAKRSTLGLLGFIYGIALVALGLASSGGGHSNLNLMLAIAPYGAGLFFWPILGVLVSDMRSSWARRIFLVLMAIHYGAFIIYLCQNWESELYWLDIATEFPWIVVLSISSFMLYLLGQLFLWSAFLKARTISSA
jgi:hypothetical protein